MEIKKLEFGNDESRDLLSRFLQNAGGSLVNFRYFKTRSFDSIKNHLYTILLIDNVNPIGYGHLDLEDGNVWLGIAVAEGFQGKGLGKLILENLIYFSKESNLPLIKLSVDKVNNSAIALYKKYGFNVVKDLSESIYLMQLENN